MNKTFLIQRKRFGVWRVRSDALPMAALLLALAVGFSAFVSSAFAGTPSAYSQVIGATHILSLSIPAAANIPKQPNTVTYITLTVSDTYLYPVIFECTIDGVPTPDVVTPTDDGAPSTGGATAVWNPTPVGTGNETILTMATMLQTEPAVYTITVSGIGVLCGQYPSSTIIMTLLPALTLQRDDLTTVEATGYPSTGGTFGYTVAPVAGSSAEDVSVGFATGNNATTDPNTATLTAPALNCNPPGAPCHGGLVSVTTNFMDNMLTASNDTDNPYEVATFGTSCYDTALESDWGNPGAQPPPPPPGLKFPPPPVGVLPGQNSTCTSISYNGITYSGVVENPDGLTGTYCSSFILDAELQGSAQLSYHPIAPQIYIQYNSSTGTFSYVSVIEAADGTPPVANQTVARDRAIIPVHNSYIDLDQIGTGLLANDIGGAITGYRIDLYKGIGQQVCVDYNNIMTVGACETAGQANCPTSPLQ
ncbi:MAG: 3D domain-containing protein [Gammaproteobacteria bacterium]